MRRALALTTLLLSYSAAAWASGAEQMFALSKFQSVRVSETVSVTYSAIYKPDPDVTWARDAAMQAALASAVGTLDRWLDEKSRQKKRDLVPLTMTLPVAEQTDARIKTPAIVAFSRSQCQVRAPAFGPEGLLVIVSIALRTVPPKPVLAPLLAEMCRQLDGNDVAVLVRVPPIEKQTSVGKFVCEGFIARRDLAAVFTAERDQSFERWMKLVDEAFVEVKPQPAPKSEPGMTAREDFFRASVADGQLRFDFKRYGKSDNFTQRHAQQINDRIYGRVSREVATTRSDTPPRRRSRSPFVG